MALTRWRRALVALAVVASVPVVAAWKPLPVFDHTIAWTGCGEGFECGTLNVPVDWSRPASGTLSLALIRHAAESPDRIGALVFNYGGPGEPGVESLRRSWSRIPDAVRARFDLVSFDPRGTGASRPIDCVDDAFLDLAGGGPAVPDTAAALDVVRRYNAAFAAGCKQRMGAYAGQVGTRNAARDLEAIRIALGESKLTYVGYSYGTILGITYAQMFPSSVRAMVLDGPPDYWLSANDYAHAQATGFMHALEAFFTWCEQTACAVTQLGAPRDVLNQLIARVTQQPLPAQYMIDGQVRDGTLTASLLESGVLALLYDESRGWPALGGALVSAMRDGWGGPLLANADQYLGRHLDGTWSPMVEANAVIYCDDRPLARQPSAAAELTAVTRLQSELPPWGGAWGVNPCAGMPKPAKNDRLGDVHVTGAPPIVVIGTTGDPAAPYAGAQAMTGRIAGSVLLTYDSTEHTAYGRDVSSCIDAAVDTYLVDGTAPAPGTHCAAG